MKKGVVLLLVMMVLALPFYTQAQCSICTKTAMQLGEGPAKGLNAGILYLMATPLAIMGIIGFRWWKREKSAAA